MWMSTLLEPFPSTYVSTHYLTPSFGWMSLEHSPQRHLFCGIPINLLWSLCRHGEVEESADSRVTSFHYRKTKRHGATHGFGKKLNLVINSIKAPAKQRQFL